MGDVAAIEIVISDSASVGKRQELLLNHLLPGEWISVHYTSPAFTRGTNTIE